MGCELPGNWRTAKVHHRTNQFWPDDVSLRDETRFIPERMHGSRLLTELYLPGLAVSHEGRLVTFDQGIPLSAVRKAGDAHFICA